VSSAASTLPESVPVSKPTRGASSVNIVFEIDAMLFRSVT
jgi:hypothetical protein